MRRLFFTGKHPDGFTVFIELTMAQAFCDDSQSDTVDAYEERGGELVHHSVELSEISCLREEAN